MIEEASVGFLAGSDLAEEVESVKFSPALMSLEELSRLWSVLFQTPYVLSIAYQGTVVFIDAQETPQPAPLVRERQIFPLTFRQPFIQKLDSADGPGRALFAGDTLVIQGHQFGAESLVRFRGVDGTFAPAEVQEDEIRLSIPASLRGGVQGVQVLLPIALGQSVTPHPGVEADSNVVSFVLCPKITVPAAAVVNTRTPVNPPLSVNGTPLELCAGTLTIGFEPPIDAAQKVILLLNEINPPAPDAANPGDPPRPKLEAQSYRFDAPPRPDATSQLAIAFQNVRQGDYLVRVQVDGAQSPLERDENPASPTFRQYIRPQVSIQ